MEVVFHDEIPKEEPQVIILENIVLNTDQEHINENPLLDKDEVKENKVYSIENILNEEKEEQENIEIEIEDPTKLILERSEKDKTYEEVQEVNQSFDKDILHMQNKYD